MEGFFLDTYAQNCLKRIVIQARSSGGERYPDTVEVESSNLSVPTMQIKELAPPGLAPFLFLLPFCYRLSQKVLPPTSQIPINGKMKEYILYSLIAKFSYVDHKTK
jgi:hypothetical protein